MSWIDARSGHVPSRTFEGYDEMQVCVNGHRINECAKTQPDLNQKFCMNCGAKTIQACEGCHAPIKGYYHTEGVFSTTATRVPSYCSECGAAHPWQRAAIENLQEILRGSAELSDDDIVSVEITLPDVVRETPKTESAALKLKRLFGKLGKPTYEIAIRVVGDIASETAKRTMGLR